MRINLKIDVGYFKMIFKSPFHVILLRISYILSCCPVKFSEKTRLRKRNDFFLDLFGE